MTKPKLENKPWRANFVLCFRLPKRGDYQYYIHSAFSSIAFLHEIECTIDTECKVVGATDYDIDNMFSTDIIYFRSTKETLILRREFEQIINLIIAPLNKDKSVLFGGFQLQKGLNPFPE